MPLWYHTRVRVFALLTLVVLLAGCTTPIEPSVPSVPPENTSAAAPVVQNPFATIAQRLTAPASGKSVDELETDSAKKPEDKAALKALGLGYYNAGGYEPAIATLSKLPDDPEATFYQAASLLAIGKDNEAVALLNGLKTPQAALLRGDYNYLKGINDKVAVTEYTQALKSPETQGQAALALGTILIVTGDRAEAKKLFTIATTKLPAGESRARAYASMGRMLEEANQEKEAHTWYQKALKDDPNNAWARQSLEPTPPPPAPAK